MLLPTYDSRPIQQVKLPVSQEIIHVKPYNVAQEQIILDMMVDTDNKTEFLINMKKILKENIEGEFDIDNMFLTDMIYLNTKLRAISKSESIEYIIHCDNPECEKYKKPQKMKNDISDVIFVKNNGNEKNIVKIDERLTVELQPVKLNFVDYLASQDNSDDDLSEIDNIAEDKLEQILDKQSMQLALVNIAYSIKRVVFDTKVYEKFSIEELLKNILVNFTPDQITLLQKEKNKLASIYLKLHANCSSCGKLFEKEENNFFVFLT